MEDKVYDAIIVGRGPVGLFLACEFALQGLSVLVVERRLTSGKYGLDKVGETRACVLHARTLEILENRGLLDQFVKDGMRLDWGHFGVLDTRLQFHAFGDQIKQNCILFTPQYLIEEIFLQRALELGVTLRLGIRIQSLKQSESSVEIYGTSSSEVNDQTASFTATGKYVIGADGWRSSIRSLGGFSWEPKPATQSMMSVEAKTDVSFPGYIVLKNKGGVVIGCQLKVPSGRARLVAWTPSTAHRPLSEPPTLEEFNQAMTEVTGTDFKLYDPCMLTRFNDESGCVGQYRIGRVLLAGDACHKHLPAGGQGLNMGVQEAYNLGWKLGAVVRGEASDSLLETYGNERIPIAKSVVLNTTAQSLLQFAQTGPELAVRETVERLVEVPEANKKLAERISGLGYSYPTPLHEICPDGWEVLPADMTGKRASDIKFRTGTGSDEAKYLRDYLKLGKWVQLRFLSNNPGNSGAAVPAFGDRTEVVDVLDIVKEQGTDPSTYQCGLGEILIRPDGHFGFGKR
jgi:2-polyprenyl-6-methoxyphenol hydroxylase-like FAD-dependent oxidoreductase